MLHAEAEVQSWLQDQRLEASIVEADMAEIVAAHKEQAATVVGSVAWISATCGDLPHHHHGWKYILDRDTIPFLPWVTSLWQTM